MKEKKPFNKKGLFIGLAIFFVVGGMLNILQGGEKNKPDAPIGMEAEEKEDKDNKGEVKLDLSIPEREFTLGKSDKNFLDITNSKPTDIRNDVTESWKMVKISENVDVAEYLISYSDLYFGEDDSVHVLINFNYNTTTVFNDYGSYLSVRVHEYVKREEHDAKKIGRGLQLAEYNIYKDNGDIVDFDKLVEAEENEG